MSDALGSRMGDINNGGSDPLQLFLKIFGNEVLTTFNNQVVMRDKIIVKRIAHGKSA